MSPFAKAELAFSAPNTKAQVRRRLAADGPEAVCHDVVMWVASGVVKMVRTCPAVPGAAGSAVPNAVVIEAGA